MYSKEVRIMTAATSGFGEEARLVRARRLSKTGRRSRGSSVAVSVGPSEVGGLRRVARGGTADVMLGVVEAGKTWEGFRLMRMRARAWDASLDACWCKLPVDWERVRPGRFDLGCVPWDDEDGVLFWA